MLLNGYGRCIINGFERGIKVEELAKQVKHEMLRTALWFAVSLGVGIGIFMVLWR